VRAIWKPGDTNTSGRGDGAPVGTNVVAGAVRLAPAGIVTVAVVTAKVPSVAGSVPEAIGASVVVPGASVVPLGASAGWPSGASTPAGFDVALLQADRASRASRRFDMGLLDQAMQRGQE